MVEVDETCIGGKEQNNHGKEKLKHGHGAVGKRAVIGARARGGHVKAQAIATTDAKTLKGFVQQPIEPGATVYPDDHRGYLAFMACATIIHPSSIQPKKGT